MIREFSYVIEGIIDEFVTSQEENLQAIASVIADQVVAGGKLFTIGTGHSHMVGEEFYARAGGLACTQLIAPMELTLGEHPIKSTQIERIKDYAQVIFTQYPITSQDVLLISSNSGRNGLPVELAIECQRRGIKTIAFTNLKHSQNVTSRHNSGKRLYEVCDYVIDSCGVIGDALMEVPGTRGKMGASSSIIGMFMAQCLSMLIAAELSKRNMEPPVFLSANVDAGDEWNQSIMQQYYKI